MIHTAGVVAVCGLLPKAESDVAVALPVHTVVPVALRVGVGGGALLTLLLRHICAVNCRESCLKK